MSMAMKLGTKVRYLGRDEAGLVHGKIYTVLSVGNAKCHLIELGKDASFLVSMFEMIEVKPGTKVRWLGPTEFPMLTNGKVYTVLSVEKEWFRVVDDSGEDYLYPPEKFDIVEDVA